MKIPANKIESAVSKDESRYTLQAVKLDVEKKRMMATDGHILAVVPVEVAEGDHSTLLSLETIKALRALQKRAKSVPVQVNTNGKIVAEACGERIEHEPTTGQFPNVDMVIPKFDGPPTITFNVDLLKRLSDALHSDPKGYSGNVVSLWIKDSQSSILVKSTASDDKECIGVLLPCRP